MDGFDPGNDLVRVADGLLPVCLHRPGTSHAIPIAQALRQSRAAPCAQRSGAEPPARDVVWHLPAEQLPITPRPGDVLVASDGRRWTVLTVEEATLGSRWRCVCRDLIEMHGLNQSIDIEKASYRKAAQGQQEIDWHTWRTGVRARIQPVSSKTASEHPLPATVARYRIYCLEDLELNHHHRIRGPDGARYRILGTSKADRIDALLEIDVVKLP